MAFDIFLFALLCFSTGKSQRLFTIINQLTTISVRKIRDARRGLAPTGQDSTAEQRRPKACLQPCSLPPGSTGTSRVSDSGFSFPQNATIYVSVGSAVLWIRRSLGKGPLQAEPHRRSGPAQNSLSALRSGLSSKE